MRIREINGFSARCEAKGVEREANLLMLQEENLRPGDYVVIHLGYAMDKVSEEEARAAWEVYDQMLAAADESGGSP